MNKSELSPVAVGAALLATVALLGGILWLGSGRKPTAEAYSRSVAQKEVNPEFSRAVQNERNYMLNNKEAIKTNRELTRDNDYQPESGKN